MLTCEVRSGTCHVCTCFTCCCNYSTKGHKKSRMIANAKRVSVVSSVSHLVPGLIPLGHLDLCFSFGEEKGHAGTLNSIQCTRCHLWDLKLASKL